MDQGKPAYTYNWFGLHSYTVAATEAISGNEAEIKLQFDYDEAGEGLGKGGKATIYVRRQAGRRGPHREDPARALLRGRDCGCRRG